ncbi:MAG: hypothetical protein EON98_07550 [Chitinophagaceae bacterium]|nr:MAG: hypothetical protein EON98_07550 [Chitinophagaceae bacterium]
MNTYLHGFLTYFENVIHPAAGKGESPKNKSRSSKPSYALQATPDCLNIRTAAKAQNSLRRNPAP